MKNLENGKIEKSREKFQNRELITKGKENIEGIWFQIMEFAQAQNFRI